MVPSTGLVYLRKLMRVIAESGDRQYTRTSAEGPLRYTEEPENVAEAVPVI